LEKTGIVLIMSAESIKFWKNWPKRLEPCQNPVSSSILTDFIRSQQAGLFSLKDKNLFEKCE
jgi:hypothetical protein